MEQANIFAEGIYFDKPREGAPEFVKGRIALQPEKLYQWAKQYTNDKGYVNIDLKKSKEGKLYLQLNTYGITPKANNGEATQDELRLDTGSTTYDDNGVTKTVPF